MPELKGKKKPKVVVIMPAYNAAKTLEKTYNDIPKDLVNEVILVDDGSSDKTVRIAKKLKLKVFLHSSNLGYGGNQKTCYWEALKRKPDIVVMIHPDYQYDATLTRELIYPITKGRADIMLGSRIRSRQEAFDGGMPSWKYFPNRFLTILENVVLGLTLSEYHTGFRAYSAKALEKIPFMRMSNSFVFDQEILISAVANNFKVGEIPVPVRYFPEASSASFWNSVKYGLGIIWTLFLYVFNKEGRLFKK
ncbi:glycosyl transferase family 2 [Candidatus Beckwithbacteria bacterium CG10_big_fil_rev_8_21_14_0_10_34_10]|uniref:Glycosyl transferase family 2 n=1 Tax=Candidatus Beckwithbacteria bacterium CG10_big_fil_rev_8_21_14_0_10_34_10 TaxID=1974495 RepID=A0A2H0W9Q0_9BACT|nr:MAG: glycosyl transferase family 2 [Candidatus Beckwithbacteria bacterium CG10_big_fil_rev_8_21_14_0_10_34_10]